MQLFLFLNDLAGRWPLLDEVARFFYIGALPALGTLLLAQLLVLPRPASGTSRSKVALALVLSFVLGMLLVWGFDIVAGWLHLGNLSPRPWMTRRVNWLVVEPQDDSFPCAEVLLAAAVACASWKLNSRWGIVSWVVVVLLSLTRLFCGNNYFADVLVGMALGASSFVLCWQLCQRYLPFGQRAREFCLSASPLAFVLMACYMFGLFSPRFASKLDFVHPAAAATSPAIGAHTSTANIDQGEGEGMAPDEDRAEELALAKRSALFLPQVEAFLRGKLSPLARPFTLLDVEVAPVKAGTTSYRCAAIRFEVPAEQPNLRPLVADRAAHMVQTAFALDSHLENVDVVVVARDQGRNLDNSMMTFAGDEVPVFTASIQRKNLVVASPAWANSPLVDGLSWLRARSLLYINARALPASPEPTSTSPTVPLPLATAGASPQASGTPAPSPTPQKQKKPTTSVPATPRALASPAPRITPFPTAKITSPPRQTPRPLGVPTHVPPIFATPRPVLHPTLTRPTAMPTSATPSPTHSSAPRLSIPRPTPTLPVIGAPTHR